MHPQIIAVMSPMTDLRQRFVRVPVLGSLGARYQVGDGVVKLRGRHDADDDGDAQSVPATQWDGTSVSSMVRSSTTRASWHH